MKNQNLQLQLIQPVGPVFPDPVTFAIVCVCTSDYSRLVAKLQVYVLMLSITAARSALHNFIHNKEVTSREKDLLLSVKVSTVIQCWRYQPGLGLGPTRIH